MKIYIFEYMIGYGSFDFMVVQANNVEKAQEIVSKQYYKKERKYVEINKSQYPYKHIDRGILTYREINIMEREKWLKENEEGYCARGGILEKTVNENKKKLEVIENSEPMFWWNPLAVFDIAEKECMLGEFEVLE